MKYRPLIAIFSVFGLAVLFFAGRRPADNSVHVPAHQVVESVEKERPEDISENSLRTSVSCTPVAKEEAKKYIESLGVAVVVGQGIPVADAPMPQQIALQLNDGSELAFELTGKEVRGASNVSWTGEVAGEPGSMVVLTRLGGVIDGYINTLDRGELKVAGKVGEPLKLERLHLEKGFCTTCAAEHAVDSVPAGFQSLEQSAMVLIEEQGIQKVSVEAGANPTVDMLVVYSQRARAAVGGKNAMNAAIINGIASLNSILALSDVALTVRLIHVEELQYDAGAENDGGVSTGLARLSNGGDGYIDEALTLRNTYGADLVAFAIDSTSGLGVANIFQPWSCIDVGVSFSGVAPHEWGHNLGCGHNDSGTGQTNLQGAYGYSYGHYFDYPSGTPRGTIMSYIGQRFSRFSNPNVNWNGNPTGTAARNHALTIENTKTTMGGWKTASATDLDLDGILNVDEPVGDSDGDGLPDLIDPDFDEVVKPFYGFSNDGDFEGWTSVNISNKTVAGGWLGGIATSADPQLPITGLSFPGATGTTALVRLQADINSNAQLFWGHTEANNIVGARSVSTSYNGNGAPQVLAFDFSSNTEWTTKTITRLRFDPMSGASAPNKEFSIDWIALTDGDYDADGIADATDGYGDTDEDGLPDFADTESDGDGMIDADEAATGRDHADAGDMAFHFNTDGDFGGWVKSPTAITGLVVSNGTVQGIAVSGDPYFANYALGFLASQVSNMTVRIRAGANATVQLYWAPQGGGFVGNFVDEAYNGNGGWQVLEFPMAGRTNWDGKTIEKLRMDPIAAATWFEIDWIRAANGDADFDGFSDVVEGAGDTDFDTVPDYLDEDSDNDGFADWQENIAGTDRTNAGENTFLVGMGSLGVEIDGKSGRLYSLQNTTNLFIPLWATIDTRGPLASDQSLIFTNSTTESTDYYRVLVELP